MDNLMQDTGLSSSGSGDSVTPNSDAGTSSAPGATSGRSGKRAKPGRSESTSFSLTPEEALGIWLEDIGNLAKAGIKARVVKLPDPPGCVAAQGCIAVILPEVTIDAAGKLVIRASDDGGAA